MTLGFTPAVEIYGANAKLLNERLVSWVHTDASGIESDKIKLIIDIEGLESVFGWVTKRRGWSTKACL